MKKCPKCKGKGRLPRPSQYDNPARCPRCRGTGDAEAETPDAHSSRVARGLSRVVVWFDAEDMSVLNAGKEAFGSYAQAIRAMLRKFK